MSAALLRHDPGRVRLVDALLEEQQQLNAVERFAQRHADADGHLGRPYYEDLIPATRPGAGQQYAFRVDLDACTGCKACVTACHSLNGLDAEEAWRSVGAMVGGAGPEPVLQTVTTACHHCEDPGCLSGCPVMAYEKDPETGIVRHLDDQCFGCQYCTLKCPYEVPRYSAARGIVRKCDMCSDRLAAGEAPACVQGCPNDAIAIQIVDRGAVEGGDRLLPLAAEAMPESSLTRPTTRYVSRRQWPADLRPADAASLRPAAGHTPLAVMLVLSQLAVGLLLLERLSSAALQAGGVSASLRSVLAATALLVTAAAGGAALLHLGRPWLAWRAVLGLRTSWMSREVVALGAFAGALLADAAVASALWLAPAAAVPPELVSLLSSLLSVLSALSLALGLVTVLCSVMIYADTGRALWTFRRTASAFFGSVVVLGAAGLLVLSAGLDALGGGASRASVAAPACLLLVVASAAKLAVELSLLHRLRDAAPTALARSARLMLGTLRGRTAARLALGVLGGWVLPLALLASGHATQPAAGLAALVFGAVLAGELLERHLFFAGMASPAMPGA